MNWAVKTIQIREDKKVSTSNSFFPKFKLVFINIELFEDISKKKRLKLDSQKVTYWRYREKRKITIKEEKKEAKRKENALMMQ